MAYFVLIIHWKILCLKYWDGDYEKDTWLRYWIVLPPVIPEILKQRSKSIKLLVGRNYCFLKYFTAHTNTKESERNFVPTLENSVKIQSISKEKWWSYWGKSEQSRCCDSRVGVICHLDWTFVWRQDQYVAALGHEWCVHLSPFIKHTRISSEIFVTKLL